MKPTGRNTTSVRPFYIEYPILTALGLSMGPALSIGLGRFSYALFLPMMREDLHWSYFTAGLMNTGNAIGYLIGALSMAWLIKRFSAAQVFVIGGLIGNLFMALSGFFTDPNAFFMCRLLIGVANTFVFAGGSVLAAQLTNLHPRQAGWLMGIYYGGGGLGIIIPSFLVPEMVHTGQLLGWAHPWQLAWYAIAAVCCIGLALMWFPAHNIPAVPPRTSTSGQTSVRRYGYMVSAYVLFGMGYIGYMTFVIALLMQLGLTGTRLNIFYALLGVGVLASSRIWARALDRFKGGETLAIITILMGGACLIPALIAIFAQSTSADPDWVTTSAIYLSGMVFGSGVLAAVATTTVFIRNNLPQSQWVAGIAVFTSLFAVGQVVGPTLIGWVSDGSGGLSRGFLLSAGILLMSAVLSWLQKPLVQATIQVSSATQEN
jgi:MFS family permease